MRLPTQLLRRRLDSHKGDFGNIFILAGSARFSGAAVLCAEAAMRSGAGLVTLGVPKSLNLAIIKIKPKEVMTLPLPETNEGSLNLSGYKKIRDFIKQADVLAIGPGLSRNKSTQGLVRKLVGTVDKPLVLDADGLNALVGRLGVLRNTPALPAGRQYAQRITVLTPHPGEMARLLGINIRKVQSDRKQIAQEFSRRHRVTLVLKGHNTVVADYKGNLYINKTGNPGMATAGSGDVLTGIIAAFLGQGLDTFSAAKYAVYLHGAAGDLAAKEKTQMGMIASDIIENIPEAIRSAYR
ncbi:MAG: NAD(P)H-hydrate dehydratase [Candidatus Omnitrophica bacterium]|nr:NAD(P)H-hydrate dehydratase [Candidatus Omnitrophota bacterium]